MNKAALMLIIKDGLVLGVSRKFDHSKFGLPGGKVEDNETLAAAAIRETFEETSIKVKSCIPIFSQVEPSSKDSTTFYNSHTFLALEWEGNPIASEEGLVKWVTKSELIKESAAYPKYNTDLFSKLNSIKYLVEMLYPEINLDIKE